MYSMAIDGKVRPQLNASVREYARLEYRREDVAWIIATAKAARKARRPARSFRLFARRARPSHRPVACKGSPKRSAAEAAVPA